MQTRLGSNPAKPFMPACTDRARAALPVSGMVAQMNASDTFAVSAPQCVNRPLPLAVRFGQGLRKILSF